MTLADRERLAEFDQKFTHWIAPLVHDPVQRALSLAHGLDHWIYKYQKEFRGYGRLADDSIALSARAGLHALHHRDFPEMSPSEFLDAIEIPSAPTQDQIDKAWRVDSASSHEARQMLYGSDSPNAPQAVLDQITREKAGERG